MWRLILVMLLLGPLSPSSCEGFYWVGLKFMRVSYMCTFVVRSPCIYMRLVPITLLCATYIKCLLYFIFLDQHQHHRHAMPLVHPGPSCLIGPVSFLDLLSYHHHHFSFNKTILLLMKWWLWEFCLSSCNYSSRPVCLEPKILKIICMWEFRILKINVFPQMDALQLFNI